jgi:hypothetical protein
VLSGCSYEIIFFFSVVLRERDGKNKHLCFCFQCSVLCVIWTVIYGQSETGLRTCVSDMVGHLSSLLVHGSFEKVFLCMVAACHVGL